MVIGEEYELSGIWQEKYHHRLELRAHPDGVGFYWQYLLYFSLLIESWPYRWKCTASQYLGSSGCVKNTSVTGECNTVHNLSRGNLSATTHFKFVIIRYTCGRCVAQFCMYTFVKLECT